MIAGMEIFQGLTKLGFDRLWFANHDWYEAPNLRRGGWSGVSKTNIETAQGRVAVYLKKQYKHSYRSWVNLFVKQPTALREYRNIIRMQTAGIPTVEPILFAVKSDTAILATRALEKYQSLDQVNLKSLSIQKRRQLIRVVAKTIRKLHLLRYQHGCLYPKHIFVYHDIGGWSVKLIDLEKMKRRCFIALAMKHDLDTLNRRSQHLFNHHDRLTFILAYIKHGRSRFLMHHLIKKCQS